MSSKYCARCTKTVYPTEELKCLDKLWHKTCFKCQECGMTLNMKTYKGFNKLPYCTAHCPQAKHTTVADTPENRRLAENTKMQSQIKYHEEFERQKGKVTQVADDPETMRIREASKIISNVTYHGDLEKKKAMEQRRTLLPESNGVEIKRPLAEVQTPQVKSQPKITEYEPFAAPLVRDSPYSAKQTSTVIYTSDHGPVDNPPARRIGSIADYDPINDSFGSVNHGAHMMPPNYYTNNTNSYAQRNMPPAINNSRPAGQVFRAMYDYNAQDADEVSFVDGDLIVNCTSIDEGWMTGMVQRTGQTGMLPANYVEPAH